ncbi:hypothetical protein ABFX02_02G135400 [Erythranthe guttata]
MQILAYINAWTGASLSYAGRAELIRAVVQGVECFWLSIFSIPVTVRTAIIKLCRAFLWGKAGASVAWKKCCLPKTEGGLGLRELGAWNAALITKNLWEIQSKKDSLWVRWVNCVYLRQQSVWEWVPGRQDSAFIKYLASIRDQIRLHFGSEELAIANLTKWYGLPGKGSAAAYDCFRPRAAPRPWANVVWCPTITPKHSFILWLGILSRLKTRNRIKHVEVEKSCIFCTEPETVVHLFFGCTFTYNIWSIIREWMGFPRAATTLKSALKWLKKEARGSCWRQKAKKVALACTVYQIWSARNRKIFENETPRITEMVRKIKILVYKTVFALFPQSALQIVHP